jgi:eukaryotic-like serine/threonine-protein kinase
MVTRFQDVLAQYPGAVSLGVGGQKEVLRVTDQIHGPSVLKIGIAGNLETQERIRREVAALKGIDSPYYPKNFDYQELDNGRFYILEEYLDALKLTDCINDYSEPQKALGFVRELMDALGVLWDQRIVHRDVKPDNILVTKDGTPRVIDLGIARLQDLETITKTHFFIGTKAYASPEQLKNAKTVDF